MPIDRWENWGVVVVIDTGWPVSLIKGKYDKALEEMNAWAGDTIEFYVASCGLQKKEAELVYRVMRKALIRDFDCNYLKSTQIDRTLTK
jgi:hypothetical protein